MTRASLVLSMLLFGCGGRPSAADAATKKVDAVAKFDSGLVGGDGTDSGVDGDSSYEGAPAGLFRAISVEDLVPRPPPPPTPWPHVISTFRLPTRRAEAPPDELNGMWGIRSSTSCGKGCYCVDGLVDETFHHTLVAAKPNADERRLCDGHGYLERVIVRADYHDDYASFYLLTSEYTPGGNHANNGIECWTFDRATGRRVDLAALLGADLAKRVLRVANHSDINDWIELGTMRPSGAFGSFSNNSLLLLRGSKGRGREVVLCADTWFGAGDGNTLQLNVDRLPLTFLMKR